IALKDYYDKRYKEKAEAAAKAQAQAAPVHVAIPADGFVQQLKELLPSLEAPPSEYLKGRSLKLELVYPEEDLTKLVGKVVETPGALVSLAPLETITIYFMVCLVLGLVLASPWVFYQIWAFIAAGLYRHERHYVTKFLPFSLGLFLFGVFL